MYQDKNLSVLIIDDMKLVRLRLFQLCTKLGFKNILEAENGLAAWNIIKSSNIIPSLILTDYNMPDMNGLKFLEQARSHDSTKNTPVIFITAEGEKNLIIDALSLGVTDFVVKPFSDDVLTEKIKSALGRVM
jgi:two-component system, chemotaxis family, chemotaxis protein CheY